MTAPSGRIDRDSLRGRLILMLAGGIPPELIAIACWAILGYIIWVSNSKHRKAASIETKILALQGRRS